MMKSPRLVILYFLLGLFSFSYENPTESVQEDDLSKYSNLSAKLKVREEDIQAAVKNYEKIHNLSVDLSDENQMKFVLKPRCGKPPPKHGFLEPKPSGQTNPWIRRTLTYKILNVPVNVTEDEVRSAMEKGIAEMTSGINLEITELEDDSDETADILVKFDPQDGVGLTLGFATFPIHSDISLDSEEYWAYNSTNPYMVNLTWAMTHELGHAIGLIHSEDENSVMYPYYNWIDQITFDDQNRLNDFYGIKKIGYDEVLCNDSKIDEIVNVGSGHYLLKGDSIWKLTDVGLEGDRIPLAEKFKNVPRGIDAVLFHGDTFMFFKENDVYLSSSKYSGKKLSSKYFHPEIPAHLDAALWDYSDVSNSKFVFFKGSLCYNLKRRGLPITVTKIADDWPGVPNDVEAASMFMDKAWFVKEGKLYVFDVKKKRLVDGSPMDFRKRILKCPDESYE